MVTRWLFTRIDNSALIVFRIFYGFLLATEAIGAIFSGWVDRIFIEPSFTFNFIGLDFLQPLPGDGMIWYYALLGLLGIFVMLGYRYRFSITLYAILWAGVYFMQKSSYNNHYYLLMLLNFLMILVPAHRYGSLDVLREPEIKRINMSRWIWVLLVGQIWLVYTFAAIAKIYPDWFNATLPGILMVPRNDYWLVGGLLQNGWVHYGIAYFGFLFDLLIVPLLLWKRTRPVAFLISLFFHLFNSFIFHIGIFPYLALAYTVFFFPTSKINHLFLKSKLHWSRKRITGTTHKSVLIFLGLWFAVQLILPLRHWFIQDNVLWTEEGHRLSWRMMLRSKTGIIQFKVVDKHRPGDTIFVAKEEYLTPIQQRALPGKPDLIWQFAQHLEKEFATRGKRIEVYVDSKLSVNGRPYFPFIDPEVDLAETQWNHWEHSDWILASPVK